jgi:threonine dehydratase
MVREDDPGTSTANGDPDESDGPPARAVREPTPDDVTAARAVVTAHLRPTPVVPVRLPGVEGEVLLKLESLQPTGSFKVRGALAAVAAYAPSAGRVVTPSAGNAALGVAFAAARLGVPATLVVPETASAAKVAALRELGADLVLHGADYEEAERHALALAAEGAAFVSPYNDPHVIAGQSTVGDEVGDQVGDDVTLLVPVGGGGLVSGCALWAAERPRVHLVGVESAASPAVSSAVRAGRIVTVEVGPTIADGLGGNIEPGSVTPAVAGRRVDTWVQVPEDLLRTAVRLLATRCGLVVEGAGAVGVAALLGGLVEPAPGTAPVVLVTGRNIAPALLAELLTTG